jgi:hypothetical protein
MKVKEVVKKLIATDNYLSIRLTVSDDFIEFIKEMLPSDYEYFKEKEEAYQELKKLIE